MSQPISLITAAQGNPPPPSKEDMLRYTKRALLASVGTGYAALCEMQKDAITKFWKHHLLTPQEVADELGTLCGQAVTFHGILTDAIVSMATLDGITPDILLPPFAFTINADGTVTISDQPYSPA